MVLNFPTHKPKLVSLVIFNSLNTNTYVFYGIVKNIRSHVLSSPGTFYLTSKTVKGLYLWLLSVLIMTICDYFNKYD